jgi:hypothetical protein
MGVICPPFAKDSAIWKAIFSLAVNREEARVPRGSSFGKTGSAIPNKLQKIGDTWIDLNPIIAAQIKLVALKEMAIKNVG